MKGAPCARWPAGQRLQRPVQELDGQAGDRSPVAVSASLTPALSKWSSWSTVLRTKIPTRRRRDFTQEGLVSQRDATALMAPQTAPLAPTRRIGEQCAPVGNASGKATHVDQVVLTKAQVSSRARVGPIHRAVGQAGAHRIHQDIASRGIQVRLVHRKGGEPPLPKAAGPALPPVDDGCVASVRLPDTACEAPCGGRNRDEVNVVGKQAVSPDRDRQPLALLGQELSVELVVESAEERRLPPVSSLGHMVS